MATVKYICKKCDSIREFDSRRKNIICPICSSDISRNPFNAVTVVRKTLYNGASYVSGELVIPDGVTSIESGAFKGSYVEEIVFPRSLENISFDCFRDCRDLKRVVIPDNVKNIRMGAFHGCSSLEELVIADGVECIEWGAFEKCEKLKSVVIPGSVKEVGPRAFAECKALEAVILSEGVKVIEKGAFESCGQLRYVSFPSTLEKIGEEAFKRTKWKLMTSYSYDCSKLKIVALPSSVQEIGKDAFADETALPGQKRTYFVQKNSAAEAYVKENGYSYETREVTAGFATGEDIWDRTLYHASGTDKHVMVPAGVEIIEESAFFTNKQLEKLDLPDSLLEIKANAFASCTSLAQIGFGSGLKTIGAKAFAGFAGKYLDLPCSVENLAQDAFPKGCVLSIGGEMPFYAKRLREIWAMASETEETRAQIKALIAQKEKTVADLRDRASVLTAVSAELAEIEPQYERAQSERAAYSVVAADKKEKLQNDMDAIQTEIEKLSAERKSCFFLAVAKKKSLDEAIERKNGEMQTLQANLSLLLEVLTAEGARFSAQLKGLTDQRRVLLNKKSKHEEMQKDLRGSIDALNLKIGALASRVEELESKRNEASAELETERKSWARAKARADKEQQKIALLAEKKVLLSSLSYPHEKAQPKLIGYTKKSGAILEYTLLNEAYLAVLAYQTALKNVNMHNDFMQKHKGAIERIIEINASLGLEAADGLSDIEPLGMRPQPVPIVRRLPERLMKLNLYFAGLDAWKRLKFDSRGSQCKKDSKNQFHDQFFLGAECFQFTDGVRYLILFPYCMVIYAKNKAMQVLTYDQAKISISYQDKEEVTESALRFGEVLFEHHKYLNADGSVSRRHKENPIVKTVRFTTVTVADDVNRFTFPVPTYRDALALQQAFHAYREVLLGEAQRSVYDLVLASADTAVIEAAIQNLDKAEKERAKLEKMALEAERQRLAEERRAAEAAAEEKRREIILRQKALNEERKKKERESAEKQKRIAKLFDDGFDDGDAAKSSDAKEMDAEMPIEVLSSKKISNTVFKVSLKPNAKASLVDFSAYFVSEAGDVISNRKKIVSGASDEEITVGFILHSGIDFTAMKTCLMRFEQDGNIIFDIKFDMNISFYSDF